MAKMKGKDRCMLNYFAQNIQMEPEQGDIWS